MFTSAPRAYEDIDNPGRVVLGHIVIKATGQQHRLAAIFTLDEAAHRSPRANPRSLDCFAANAS